MRTAYERGLFTGGLALVWRHQRLLWWIFAINLLLGLMSAHTAAHTLQEKLAHTLAGEPLVHRFDLGMFYELVDRPEVNLLGSHGDALASAVVFFLFMLFVSGGILSVYRADGSFSTGQFFAASGQFVWRFVRLGLVSLIPLLLLGWLSSGVIELSHLVDERAIADQPSFYVLVLGGVIIALLGLWLRLWFDLAQVRAVAQDERSMLPNLAECWNLALHASGRLFAAYLGITLVAFLLGALGFWVWTIIPAAAIPATFLLLEVMMLVQILVRLCQRASTTLWYQRYSAASAISAPEILPEPGEQQDDFAGGAEVV